jgi:hypothetical protein
MSVSRIQYAAAYVGKFPCFEEDAGPAVTWVGEQSKALQGGLTIVAPTMKHYRDHRLLAKLAKIGDAQTPKTLGPRSRVRPVVISFWLTAANFEQLDGATGIEAMAAVPWNEVDIEVWRAARGARDLLGNIEIPSSNLDIDPIVRVALETINLLINVSTGVTNPRDRAQAIHVFRTLRKHGHNAPSDVAQLWAMSNGWSASDARDLAGLAEGVNNGRAYQVGPYMLSENLYEQWTDEVSKLE